MLSSYHIAQLLGLLYHALAMANVLLFVEIILGILLTFLILLQHRASGLSATFGGTGTAYIQRRGAEKVLFAATIWIAVAFFVVAVAMMYV